MIQLQNLCSGGEMLQKDEHGWKPSQIHSYTSIGTLQSCSFKGVYSSSVSYFGHTHTHDHDHMLEQPARLTLT